MIAMTKKLFVYWESRLVGVLWLDEQGEYVFQYQPGWLASLDALPISLQLPLKADAYENSLSRPFFANLLPEAEVRRFLAARYGISVGNDFGLLLEIGGECAGALSLLPEDTRPTGKGKYKKITERHLDERLAEMPKRPLLSPEWGERLSLAGAQNKLPVTIKNGELFLPLGSYPSSHILKPQIPSYEETVENEAFCMMLAQKAGLDVPEVAVYQTPNNKLLSVKRYDRKADEKGNLVRLHQEDFCQALGLMPDQKYENEKGPGFKHCFDLLTENSNGPIRDKTRLIQWAVFNHLIGNADAHAKNISIMIRPNGFSLAPFYDLMSTVVYAGLDAKFSMKIGGKYKRREVSGRHWDRFAEDAGVKSDVVQQVALQLAKELPIVAKNLGDDFIEKFGGKAIVNKICDFIEKESRLLTGVLR